MTTEIMDYQKLYATVAQQCAQAEAVYREILEPYKKLEAKLHEAAREQNRLLALKNSLYALTPEGILEEQRVREKVLGWDPGTSLPQQTIRSLDRLLEEHRRSLPWDG